MLELPLVILKYPALFGSHFTNFYKQLGT
jgi:hypothetical protein